MIPIYSFCGKKIALLGLGRSGLATASALTAGGGDVTVWDDNSLAVKSAHEQGFIIEDLRMITWESISALILSPGVPLTYPKPHWSVELAGAYNVEVIGDIELFVRERNAFLKHRNLNNKNCPFIAVTGTNGKSTTTALVSHLLKTTGCDVQMGGNIGTAVLSLAPLAEERFYVIECSSYQIDLTSSINPTVGILLNITPDHIDRHGNFERYAAIKQKLVTTADTSILSIDNPSCARIYEFLQSDGKTRFPITTRCLLQEGYFSEGNMLLRAKKGKSEILASLDAHPSLRGEHNAQNALAALACCDALEIDSATFGASLSSFKGLQHRMEEVARKKHVLFINDSKATNAEATAQALATFDHIYWIAGGREKKGSIHTLRSYFRKIRKAYLIGEAAFNFSTIIEKTTSVVISGTLTKAVHQAFHDAAVDKSSRVVVLFSPACSSFDQFPNYNVRGDTFRKLVYEL